MFKRRNLGLAALAVISGMGAVPPASAQQDGQRVEVTGSRLTRLNLISPTPVLTLDSASFGHLGLENFADLATQLPQFGPAFNKSRTQSSSSDVEQSGLNAVSLRGLNPIRSLVLINGRRVPGGTSTSTLVDFNLLPTANIDRVEVITGGASAIYGADAVAGVINIITKKNFEGIEVGAGYGQSGQGDNRNPTAHLLLGGKLGDSGRGLFTLQVDQQGRVSCSDRPLCAEDFAWTKADTPLRGPAAYSGVGLGGRFYVGSASYTRRDGSFTDGSGALIPFSVAKDGYNRNADRDLAIPTKRIIAAADLEVALGQGMKAFAELNHAQANTSSRIEGHPFQSQKAGSLFAGLQATIPVDNPFMPAALRSAALAGGVTNMTWSQRFNDAGGPRGADDERATTRLAFGLKGELGSLGGIGRDWRWEVSHVWGQTRVNLNTEGLVNTSNLYYGLRVEADPASPGKFRCVDAAARALGCVPINPFAPYTAEMKQALRIGATSTGRSQLNDTVAHIGGTLADLPAGSLRTVFGAEVRSFSGFLDHDNVINKELATGLQTSDTGFSKTTTKEVFAEVLVPLLADKPFINALNVEGAFRHSTARNDSYDTWKFGGDWEPTNGLRLRAMQARSVRTPVPGELSGIGLTGGVVNDPCTKDRRNANPVRAANCATDGVPADYDPPLVIQQGVAGLSGGNANLKPEKGTTLTYGLVWQPASAKGLSVSIDRFDIQIDDAITVVSRQLALDKCYDTINRILCGAVTRGASPLIPGASHILLGVNEQKQNVAQYHISGVDIDLRYGMKLPNSWGELDLSLLATVYDKATLLPLAGEASVNLLGQAGGSTDDQGWVRMTANGNAGWRYGKFNANWNLRHIGRADMAVGSTDLGFPQIGAHTYHNVRAGYAFAKGSEVFAGITNLFDKKPPIFATGTSGTQSLDTVPGYYDVFGRSYFVGIRTKF